MRCGVSELPFYQRSTASDALSELIKAATGKLIVVHYADDGLISHKTILQQLKAGRTRWQSWGVRAYTSEKTEGVRPDAHHRLYWCIAAVRRATTGGQP